MAYVIEFYIVIAGCGIQKLNYESIIQDLFLEFHMIIRLLLRLYFPEMAADRNNCTQNTETRTAKQNGKAIPAAETR